MNWPRREVLARIVRSKIDKIEWKCSAKLDSSRTLKLYFSRNSRKRKKIKMNEVNARSTQHDSNTNPSVAHHNLNSNRA